MFALVIILITAFSYRLGRLRDSLNVSLMILIASASQFILNDEFIYNTFLILSLSISYKVEQIQLIKSSISILLKFSLVAFLFDVSDLIFYTDLTWSLIQSWANLYVYVYYVTIFLIFAGLAKVDQGGHRNIGARDNVFFANNNSINFRRI